MLLLFNSLCLTERVTVEQGEEMHLGVCQARLFGKELDTVLLFKHFRAKLHNLELDGHTACEKWVNKNKKGSILNMCKSDVTQFFRGFASSWNNLVLFEPNPVFCFCSACVITTTRN